jgi:hypothetical protein
VEITLRAAAGSEGVQHESEEVVDESQCHGRQSWQMGIAPWDRPDFSNGTRRSSRRNNCTPQRPNSCSARLA